MSTFLANLLFGELYALCIPRKLVEVSPAASEHCVWVITIITRALCFYQPLNCVSQMSPTEKIPSEPCTIVSLCKSEIYWWVIDSPRKWFIMQFWSVSVTSSCHGNTLTHWGRDKMDAISQTPFSNAFSWLKNVWIPIQISLRFVPKVLINNIPALVQILARRRSGDKPSSEPMMVS